MVVDEGHGLVEDRCGLVADGNAVWLHGMERCRVIVDGDVWWF